MRISRGRGVSMVILIALLYCENKNSATLAAVPPSGGVSEAALPLSARCNSGRAAVHVRGGSAATRVSS